ncbi:Gsf2p [Sugiyamaella lignohabitans]|uniref:Gsf2p n=1 Tax=Sugiyamaella lignohabitans TaxID=796027 RepID=A0A167CNL2_9ASCO|nr:Gsf2p [Sugiyamaella lignohabitans]ANB11926.1 Gsf2p [Sugiyamaella lignohabitans]
MNPLKNRSHAKKEITREELLSIGWTGTRRATAFEWSEENRKTKIEAAGGVVNAYHQGILEDLRNSCIKLDKGEGWDSPGPQEKQKSESEVEEGRFLLSTNYFKLVYSPLAELIEDESIDQATKNTALKTFRRNGPANAPEELKEIFRKRRALEPVDKKKKK